ncbi:hypothetical protein RhiirB3_430315 [Rhizophagus irregularis]|nr:hypothetical protein RhiirB3_430315 [Rhizophagus irregularis]
MVSTLHLSTILADMSEAQNICYLDDPITSGILYISEGVDDVMNILSVETRQILADVELSEPEFSKDVNTLSYF